MPVIIFNHALVLINANNANKQTYVMSYIQLFVLLILVVSAYKKYVVPIINNKHSPVNDYDNRISTYMFSVFNK